MGIEMIKWGAFHMCNYFGFLAFTATLDVVFDELAYFGSLISSVHKVPGVGDARMFSHRDVMYFLKDLSSHFRVIFQVNLVCKELFWQKSDALIRIYSPFKVLSSTKKVSNDVTLSRKVY